MKQNIALVVAFIALVLGAWAVFSNSSMHTDGGQSFGATSAGNLLAENYLPFVMYNGGYQSAKDISTTADVYGTDLFAADDLVVSGGSVVVTTTNAATSSSALGCIQTVATSTATPVRLVIGTSGATTSYQGASSVGVVGWQFGSCPA